MTPKEIIYRLRVTAITLAVACVAVYSLLAVLGLASAPSVSALPTWSNSIAMLEHLERDTYEYTVSLKA